MLRHNRSTPIHFYTCDRYAQLVLKFAGTLVTPSGSKVPRLKRMPDLHATIARAVAMQPCPLRGQDIRFLRKQLGYSAKEWATLLRTDASTLSRWENDQQELGTQSDTLIHLLYFRLRDEKEGTLSKENVATAAAAVSRSCLLNLCVNMNNSNVYSYKTRSQRARRTA